MIFSIVTPTNNSERYLAETIESVISQRGDFEIQYVIVDNCSSDRTLEIAQSYQKVLNSEKFHAGCRKVSLEIVSERDKGMYDAINNGFARTNGETMAWINSDDVYLQGAFSAVGRALSDVVKVKWLKGITSYMNEQSEIVHGGQCFLYDRRWIEGGYCGPLFPFIQQDSVFWRRELWDRAGGCDGSLKLAGDYVLWCSFSRFEPLYSFARYLSCFRRSPTQLSRQVEEYWNEAQRKYVLPGLLPNNSLRRCLSTRVLPRWMKIAARRLHLGVEEFHALVESGNGWLRLREAKVPTGSRAIQDRANSAVLLQLTSSPGAAFLGSCAMAEMLPNPLSFEVREGVMGNRQERCGKEYAGSIFSGEDEVTDKGSDWLLNYKDNIHSQGGEDGIIKKILQILPENDRWCVEFGAWDGIFLSNVRNLIEKENYSAVLIEGSQKKYQEMKKNCSAYKNVITFNKFVGFSASDNLTEILKTTPIPDNFDFLSIDVDGNDYHIWKALSKYYPKIVCIEFNPTIPTEVRFVQTADHKVNQGSSLLALTELGKAKGYELVSVLPWNAVFVKSEYFPLFHIEDNSPFTLRKSIDHVTYLFSGYDGKVLLYGNQALPWHGTQIDSSRVQPLPTFLQKYPGNYTNTEKLLFNAWTIFSNPGVTIRRMISRVISRLNRR